MESIDHHHTHLRRDKSQNLFHLLNDRENGLDRRYFNHKRSSKNFSVEFFKCITPNLTIANVEKHQNFIRKFSPDGKYLICFSRDQQSFENYKFLGTANACEMLYKWKTEYIPPDSTKGLGKEIRQNIFNQLFQLHWSIQLTSTFMRPLYREFSIFTDDGAYVIVASHLPVPEENLPSYYTLNAINPIQTEYDLYWYRFYMVRLSDGTVSDTLEFSYDFINLSHNHGVAISGNMMAVVSLFNQSINVLQLNDGKFVTLFTIGRYPHGTSECICSNVPEYEESCMMLDTMKFGGLKQKILISLYRKILNYPDKSKHNEMLRLFYRRFKIYEAMEISKVQFLDKDHLLIRYDIHKKHNLAMEGSELFKLFVLYNLCDNEILKICSEKSTDLLWLFTNFFDDFRNTKSMYTGRAPSSSSNNVQMQNAQMRLIASFPRGETEAAYRLLPQLPLSVQSFSVSPFLDLNIFHYDTQLISALERPRYSNCEPIRFSDRDSDVTLFRIHPGILESENSVAAADQQNRLGSNKELVAYLFHPFEPFVISVQKLVNRYVTNFHIRNEGTHVKR